METVTTGERADPLASSAYPLALILTTCLCAFLLNLALSWPGIMTWDSNNQYLQAVSGHYNDWFPPVMAVVWRGLLKIAPWGTGLLFAHLAIWWGAIALQASTFIKSGMKAAGWLTVLLGALPQFVLLNGFILKDVGLTACLALAFAIIFHHRTLSKPMSYASCIAVALLLVYATLVRQNGVFAVAPLICYAVKPQLITKPFWLLTLCLIICLGIIGLAGPINKHVFHAQDRNPKRSLILYDTTGIAYWSRDPSVFGRDNNPSIEMIDRCYDPRLWDQLGKQPCNAEIERTYVHGGALVRAIAKHPLAYIEHRISHYNQELFLWTSVDHWRFGDSNKIAHEPVGRFALVEQDLLPKLQSIPIFAPAVALVLLAILLVNSGSSSRYRPSEINNGVFYLALSGEAYALGYLIIGVANMYRYYEYSLFACYLGLVITYVSYVTHPSRHDRRLLVTILVATGVVTLITLLARLTL